MGSHTIDYGAPVLSTEARFGDTRRFDLDVTNVLRIRISISAILPPDTR